MKKFLLYATLFLAFGIVKSQSLQLFNGEVDVTSDTVNITVDPNTDPSALHLGVKNTSANAIDVKVKKIEETIVAGTNISLCWGINCYSPTQFVTPTAANIASGATDESFHGDYFHSGNSGTTIVMYVFFDDANPADSSYVVVEYKLDAVSVVSLEMGQFSKPYPNPANEIVTFSYSANLGTKLYIYNMLGKTVGYFELAEISGKLSIPTFNLSQGLYFYEFRNENNLLENGKIIISR